MANPPFADRNNKNFKSIRLALELKNSDVVDICALVEVEKSPDGIWVETK